MLMLTGRVRVCRRALRPSVRWRGRRRRTYGLPTGSGLTPTPLETRMRYCAGNSLAFV